MSKRGSQKCVGRKASGRVRIAEVKVVACGRWVELLKIAGMPAECLNGEAQPCPRCGGVDRFNAASDVNDTGAVFCRKCFNKSSPTKPSDGIATVAWLQDVSNHEASLWVAGQLGMPQATNVPSTSTKPFDIITATAIDKRMPVEAFRLFGVKEARRGRPENQTSVARVDLYNELGQIHSYFDLWPGDKGRVKRGKGNSGLFFPGRLPKPGEEWLAVEGVKDAAALVHLGYNAFGYCGNKLATKYARLFEGVDVVIVPDLDGPGFAGAQHTASILFGVASSVSIARLPGEMLTKNGEDVRDCLQKPDGEQQVRDAISHSTPWVPSSRGVPDDRPDVVVGMQEAAVSAEVVTHLGALGWMPPGTAPAPGDSNRIFVRGGVLVHTVESEDVGVEGRLTVRDLPPCLIRERITQAVRLINEVEISGSVELRELRPPGWLVDSIYRRGSYGGAVKPLAGVIESPTIRSDGSILQEPGYDNSTGLIFRPTVDFPVVPSDPTHEEAKDAVAELLEVLTDFPLLDAADASAWLAMTLSMIGRSCVEGYVPLFAVTANVRGAGKSLLVDASTLIAYGHRAGRKAFTRDDDEMRKTITAVALAASPSVLFDNLDVQLGGAALDAAITSPTWSDRVLGQSRMTGDLPMRTVFAATGNNLAFGSDIARRVLPIRLQSSHETPEDRSGFRHSDLLAWIESQRPRLAVAALTVLRAYFVGGCPLQPGGEWGSFDRWSEVIRGAIVWAGGADPLSTRASALAGDDTAALLGKLIVGIEDVDPLGAGMTTKEIEKRTFGTQADLPENEALADAAFEICGERFNGRKFGRRVRGFVGRVWQGRYIEADTARGGVARWRVRRVDGGFGGFGGSKEPGPDPDAACLLWDSQDDDNADSGHHSERFDKRPEANPPNQPNPPDDQIEDGSNEASPTGQEVEL